MMGKLSGLKDKVAGAMHHAQVKAADAIVTAAEPRVHSVIDTRVDTFRDSTLETLPRQCEDGLRAKSDSSSVAWIFDKVLGDNTDVLVERLLASFRPGITSATDGLSLNATATIIAKLKDLLDGDNGEAPAAAPGADVDAAAAEVQQLDVADEAPQQVSRGLDLSGDDEAEAAAAPAAAEGEGRTGVRKAALSAASKLAGGMFGVDKRLPSFEETARELVHPLFEKLKTEVWELVPASLQQVLGDMVGDKQGDVDEAGVDDDGEQGGGGFGAWMDKFKNKLEGKAGRLVDRVVAATLDAIDDPLKAAINKLVDELEGTATAAAFREIRQKLAEYKLISSEAAAA